MYESRFIEKVKVFLWRCSKGMLIHIRYLRDRKQRESYKNVMDSQQTIEYIKAHNCSVARFGDGEFQMIEHGLRGGDAASFFVDTFQSFDAALSARLNEVLTKTVPDLMICVPYPLFHSSVYRGYDRFFVEREWLGRGNLAREAAKRHAVVGDSTFTRFYLHRTDIKDYPAYITSLKGIWEGRDVILVEGKTSRLGVGNDLFDNTASIKRILCPSTNAFRVYDNILEKIRRLDRKDCLFLLALGHTATVLAYDMTKEGYQAVDLGHVDIEYEWYRMGARKKCPVPNKYVNEVLEGRVVGNTMDKEYESQIIGRVIGDKK